MWNFFSWLWSCICRVSTCFTWLISGYDAAPSVYSDCDVQSNSGQRAQSFDEMDTEDVAKPIVFPTWQRFYANRLAASYYVVMIQFVIPNQNPDQSQKPIFFILSNIELADTFYVKRSDVIDQDLEDVEPMSSPIQDSTEPGSKKGSDGLSSNQISPEDGVDSSTLNAGEAVVQQSTDEQIVESRPIDSSVADPAACQADTNGDNNEYEIEKQKMLALGLPTDFVGHSLSMTSGGHSAEKQRNRKKRGHLDMPKKRKVDDQQTKQYQFKTQFEDITSLNLLADQDRVKVDSEFRTALQKSNLCLAKCVVDNFQPVFGNKRIFRPDRSEGALMRTLRKRLNECCIDADGMRLGSNPHFAADFPRKNRHLSKYWFQRYRLFSRFDEGVKLDEESWYSVTPEQIAVHIAERCHCDLVIDGFCGAGGNTIQFAMTCSSVIAIDNDPAKIELAKHNASVYGVADSIEFICGDYFEVMKDLRDKRCIKDSALRNVVVFASPPWGGIEYGQDKSFDLRTSIPVDCELMMEVAASISPNVVMYMPKNADIIQVVSLAKFIVDEHSAHKDASQPNRYRHVECERAKINSKIKALTFYFGPFLTDHV